MSGSFRQPLGQDLERGRNPINSDDFPQEIFRLGWPYSVSPFPSAILMPPGNVNVSRFAKGGDLVVMSVRVGR
jgi:hypothetical protein